jgi:hypothetical protein
VPVTRCAEAVAVGAAAGGRDRCGSAESGEGSLGQHAFGIAASGDQQLGRGVGTDSVGGSQAGVVEAHHAVQGLDQGLVLGGQLLDARGEALQRGEDGGMDRVTGRPQPGQA